LQNRKTRRAPGLSIFAAVLLSLRDQIQKIEEFGEADFRGLCALDERVAFGAQRGHGERHGDAVVSAGIDGGAVQLLASRDIKAIFELFHFRTHGAQVACDQGDAVRLLDAQFFRIANADAAAGIRGDGGEYRQLIDELRRQRAADLGGAQAGLGRRNLHHADELGVLLFEIEDADVRAERGEHIE